MSTILPNPTLPPLTAKDFSETGYVFRGVPLHEDEDATYVYTYGHVDPETFAAAVNDYDTEVGGMVVGIDVDLTEPEDVAHRYAVTVRPGPEWWMTWTSVTAETPGAFPITVVAR